MMILNILIPPFFYFIKDLAMPNMDGFDATSAILEIMANQGIRRIPIIAVTAQALAGNKDLCFARGMDG